MNTTNLLLATTSLLVVVAFALSFGTFSKKSNTDDAAQLKKELRMELAQFRAERAEAEARRQMAYYAPTSPALTSNPVTPSVAAETPATTEISDDVAAQIAAVQEQLAEKDEALKKAEEKVEFHKEEAGMMMEEKTREAQRQARLENRVRMALKMGTVGEVNTEFGFLTFRPENDMNFNPGSELGIRRGSGILGRVVVSRQQGTEYVADIKPNAYAGGLPPVNAGDELIQLPDDYSAPVPGTTDQPGE
ncbi:MAG: hypothetical protein ACSHYF_09525 [Verrucomicrobiaceae bacterium]